MPAIAAAVALASFRARVARWLRSSMRFCASRFGFGHGGLAFEARDLHLGRGLGLLLRLRCLVDAGGRHLAARLDLLCLGLRLTFGLRDGLWNALE